MSGNFQTERVATLPRIMHLGARELAKAAKARVAAAADSRGQLLHNIDALTEQAEGAANERNGRIVIDSLREVRQTWETLVKLEGGLTGSQRIGTQVNIVQEGLPPELMARFREECPDGYKVLQSIMVSHFSDERNVTPAVEAEEVVSG